jgi:hypothetical protein
MKYPSSSLYEIKLDEERFGSNYIKHNDLPYNQTQVVHMD